MRSWVNYENKQQREPTTEVNLEMPRERFKLWPLLNKTRDGIHEGLEGGLIPVRAVLRKLDPGETMLIDEVGEMALGSLEPIHEEGHAGNDEGVGRNVADVGDVGGVVLLRD